MRLGAGGLGLALAARALSAGAQDATPEETGLPEGVLVTFPPQITPFDLPEEPGAVQIIWLVMEPNTAVPTHPHPFSEFAFMLAGTAMFLTEEGPAAQVIRADQAGTEETPEVGPPGTEVTASEGDVVIFPSGNISDTRAGDEGATLLVLEIVTAEDGMGTPEG
jgi:quercetin dioxygenase-like cupin family protein